MLFSANTRREDKLLLLILGKVAKPRCFQNATMPKDCIYKSSKRAWTTAALFKKYVRLLKSLKQSKGMCFLLSTAPPMARLKISKRSLWNFYQRTQPQYRSPWIKALLRQRGSYTAKVFCNVCSLHMMPTRDTRSTCWCNTFIKPFMERAGTCDCKLLCTCRIFLVARRTG